jgi:hypothetical protein
VIVLPERNECGLCLGTTKPLCESHIIPAYMAVKMKALSATKHFREAYAPNRPAQDLPKIPLLCDDCEQRIKVYEDKFKAAVWDPWCVQLEVGGGELPEDFPLPSEPWMDLFVFSVAWRALHVSDDSRRRRYELYPHANAADAEWRPALLAGHLPGPRSKFWVVQAKQMDELLQRRKHRESRSYILLNTHIMNSDNAMGVRNIFKVFEMVNIGGVPMQVSAGLGYELKTTPTSRGYYLSFVKGFGFCFLGVHTQDRAVAESVNLDDVVEDLLASSIRDWDEKITQKLSPKQKAKDEAAKKANKASPTVSMQIKSADERARAARRRKEK